MASEDQGVDVPEREELAPELPPAPRELPPVEPPATSFFVQLFLLPAVIVFGIMLVWFLFGRIAGDGNSLDSYVQILRSPGRGDRWKAAHDISQLLRENSVYAQNRELAVTLSEELQKGLEKKEDPKYLEYLAGALGTFQLPTGVPALRRAARPESPYLVRRAALISLARLSSRLDDLNDPNLVLELPEYLKESNTPAGVDADSVAELRGLVVTCLGFQKDPRAIRPLEQALGDPVVNVRYDAAVALSRHGAKAALPTLKEMLDADTVRTRLQAGRSEGEVPEALVFLTMENGIRSLGRMRANCSPEDWAPIQKQLEVLAQHPQHEIRHAAMDVLKPADKPAN